MALCAGLGVHWVPRRRSLHALLEDREAAGLADDEVSPLHDDDADKEGRLARELHHLPLLIGLQGGWAVPEGIQTTSKASSFCCLPRPQGQVRSLDSQQHFAALSLSTAHATGRVVFLA